MTSKHTKEEGLKRLEGLARGIPDATLETKFDSVTFWWTDVFTVEESEQAFETVLQKLEAEGQECHYNFISYAMEFLPKGYDFTGDTGMYNSEKVIYSDKALAFKFHKGKTIKDEMKR